MGIYPDNKYTEVTNSREFPRWQRAQKTDPQPTPRSLIHQYHEPGLDITYVYELIAVISDRTDCFCCSCGERDGSDPYCRNHGWAGERPCDYHDLPGTPVDQCICLPPGPVDDSAQHESICDFGKMPESVQVARSGQLGEPL